MGLFDRFLSRNEQLNDSYLDDVPEELLEIQRLIPDEYIFNQIVSLEELRILEKNSPTHWIYKYIDDPLQYSYRRLTLRSSMVGKYDKTVNYCSKGLEKFPNDPYLLYMLGRTFYDIGKIKEEIEYIREALQVLDNAIYLYPDFPDAYFERGKCNLVLNCLDSAENDFLLAVEYESDELAIQGFNDYLEYLRDLKGSDI